VIGGKAIKKGEGIIAATQSGNRDEDVFPNPDVFDMKRARGKEEALGYGWGEHRCVAEWLARAELEIAYRTLFTRIPTLRLAVPLDELELKTDAQIFGLHRLPVTW